MPLLDISNELLLCISENLQSERDINAFTRTNRRLYYLLNSYLYRYNVRKFRGWALLWAAEHGREVTAQRLLEEGTKAYVNVQFYGRTALYAAAEEGHISVVKLLPEALEVDLKDDDGRTPLSWAAGNGHEAVVKLLLEKGAELESKDQKNGGKPLSWAAGEGREAVVKLLLEKGAELESKDRKNGRTPLSWAAERGHEAVVKLLLEKGAELESKDHKYGQTPLSRAAEMGCEAVVKLLLEKGAELES